MKQVLQSFDRNKEFYIVCEALGNESSLAVSDLEVKSELECAVIGIIYLGLRTNV